MPYNLSRNRLSISNDLPARDVSSVVLSSQRSSSWVILWGILRIFGNIIAIINPHCRVDRNFEPGWPGGFPHGWFDLPREGHDRGTQILRSRVQKLGSKTIRSKHEQRRHRESNENALPEATIFLFIDIILFFMDIYQDCRTVLSGNNLPVKQESTVI